MEKRCRVSNRSAAKPKFFTQLSSLREKLQKPTSVLFRAMPLGWCLFSFPHALLHNEASIEKTSLAGALFFSGALSQMVVENWDVFKHVSKTKILTGLVMSPVVFYFMNEAALNYYKHSDSLSSFFISMCYLGLSFVPFVRVSDRLVRKKAGRLDDL